MTLDSGSGCRFTFIKLKRLKWPIHILHVRAKCETHAWPIHMLHVRAKCETHAWVVNKIHVKARHNNRAWARHNNHASASVTYTIVILGEFRDISMKIHAWSKHISKAIHVWPGDKFLTGIRFGLGSMKGSG